MQWESPHASNWWPLENLDNAMTGLHDWMMFKKYGYGRACAQISVDIRNGKISRSAALVILNDLEGKFPNVYAGVDILDILYRLDLTLDQLIEIIDKFTVEH